MQASELRRLGQELGIVLPVAKKAGQRMVICRGGLGCSDKGSKVRNMGESIWLVFVAVCR